MQHDLQGPRFDTTDRRRQGPGRRLAKRCPRRLICCLKKVFEAKSLQRFDFIAFFLTSAAMPPEIYIHAGR